MRLRNFVHAAASVAFECRPQDLQRIDFPQQGAAALPAQVVPVPLTLHAGPFACVMEYLPLGIDGLLEDRHSVLFHAFVLRGLAGPNSWLGRGPLSPQHIGGFHAPHTS